MPSRFATTVTPESRATTNSMPVPTSGASVRTSGTAWRIMFEPMSARFASSFSRKGISDAATETSWFGDTSIMSTSSGEASRTRPAPSAMIESITNLPSSSRTAFAWAIDMRSSSRADMYLTSCVTFRRMTSRYGRLDEAVSFTRAKVDSDAMRPMFGPSGVSIGQIRP